jgi:hypothetical protein
MQTPVMRAIILVVAAMALASAGAAQAADEQPICAARPGKATSTCTVPAGRIQLEIGLADWTVQNVPGERDLTLVLGETAFKYGITDRSDIEIDVTPWQRITTRAGLVRDSASGFGDIIVSYKQQITAGNSALQFALLPFVKAPTARHQLGNGKWEAGLLVPIGYTIPKSPISLNLTPEVDWAADADGQGHHAAMTQVASLGLQVNAKLNLSAELWGRWDWDPSGRRRQSSADGSVADLLSNDVQLDAGANFGLNRNTPDVELYTGASVRF